VAPTAHPQHEPCDPASAEATRHILIRFRHGLGDAVQLTVVLKHLRHYRPNWVVDVEVLLGKETLFFGVCRNAFIHGSSALDESIYDESYDLEWHECSVCRVDSPSTKAERCLDEVFRLEPIPELCGYHITYRQETARLAREYLEEVSQTPPGPDGRYPTVLIHYEGNTSRRDKDLPTETVERLCADLLNLGTVPVILDWDARTPFVDGVRIFNPDVNSPLWGGQGTGDAEMLAALIDGSTLMIGVDSGPLHLAGATTTPTIGVWTRHHPLHYFGHADHVLHLVPVDHRRLLRRRRSAGETYFAEHYQSMTYHDLESQLRTTVAKRLGGASIGLTLDRKFWIRADNAVQDLVVVQDIAEEDSYHIDELPTFGPVVVDVGAHIGCFTKRFHTRYPAAQIIAVECCPENMEALKRNVGHLATVLQAAVTYQPDAALLNAVFPDCVSTGGSILVSREELQRRVSDGQCSADLANMQDREYWADLRPMQRLTLEQVMQSEGVDRIDVLKLDCEGSEFSILRNTPSLDRIGIIVGEYHGKDAFLQLVHERFAGWTLRILRDGELGTFWLTRKRASPSRVDRVGHTVRPRQQAAMTRLLVSVVRDKPPVRCELLLLDRGRIAARTAHQQARFARFGDRLWAIDADGRLHVVTVKPDEISLTQVSESPLAVHAHDLRAAGDKLVTTGTKEDLIAVYDPRADAWSAKRPFVPLPGSGNTTTETDGCDRFHLNSALPDGDGFVLSLFAGEPKPPEARWTDTPLDRGLIVRWGPTGFDRQPIASGVYAPHSLRRFGARLWWCDSFRHVVCRQDGWRSPDLGGFTRGLTMFGGRCYVGLSRSRIAPHPTGHVCGVCDFDLHDPADRHLTELDEQYVEVYDVLPLADQDLD